jgi:hypothetical protein
MDRLRQVQTAFLQDPTAVSGEFVTDPYEAGWASEAIAFIYVRSVPDRARADRAQLEAWAEVSADGLRWVADETAFAPITAPGGYRLRVTHFGNWLRLAGRASGATEDSPFVIDSYWVFKE